MKVSGVWLPVITPFLNDEIDFDSYDGLIDYYILKGISGLIPLGTTGEGPVVTQAEFEKIIDHTLEINNHRVPVYAGAGGNFTNKVIKTLKVLEKYPVEGILSVCPYYNRPDQNGLYEHFLKISEATDRNIIIYNIPYRTGVNLQNETLFKLSQQENIIGVKDSCGDIGQTLALLSEKPENFSVLTGEDILFYTNLVNGGEGGILAASHLHTEVFLDVFRIIKENDHRKAFQRWQEIYMMIPMLFKEPNPGPIKYCLNRLNLIRSSETRLPLAGISDELKVMLDRSCMEKKKKGGAV